MGFESVGIMFRIVPIMVAIIFVLVFAIMISRVVNYGKQKTKAEESKSAKVVSKRQHIWGDRSHTNHYATFELEDGERVEYLVPSNKIGYIVEGDYGILTHQGSLFVQFSRQAEDKYSDDY